MNGMPMRVTITVLALAIVVCVLLAVATVGHVNIVVIAGALAVVVAAAATLVVAVRRSYRSQRVLQATVNGVARAIAAFENGRLVARNEQFMELLRIPSELGRIGTPAARLEQDAAG